MRISDWSSDVCSSDLIARTQGFFQHATVLEGKDLDRVRRLTLARLAIFIIDDRIRFDIDQHFGAGFQFIGADRRHKMSRSSRSEEPTSDLKSLMRLSYAVFSLKTKITSRLSTKQKKHHNTTTYS